MPPPTDSGFLELRRNPLRAMTSRLRAWFRPLTTLRRQVAARTNERDRLWNTTNDLMGVAGPGGLLIAINPAWSKLLGLTREQILAKPLAELIDAFAHPRTSGVGTRLAAGEMVTGFVGQMTAAEGGTRVVMWDAVPDGGNIHIVGRDITALQQAEEQLRQSQKMEAVGQLTGGIAHDFNNLLTAIGGSLELMHVRLAQGRTAELERYLVTAEHAAKRAVALTHRLLAFSRRQTLVPASTNINRLVKDMQDLLSRTMGPSIAVEVVTAGGLWNTRVDPHQLENALLNLCINARDAMPAGGRLTIETSNKWLDASESTKRDLPAGQYVTLSVSDNGCGMSKELIAHVFEPFFTTKPIGQGTGLGLSMVYGFVRQSGGQARIYSEVGCGARVSLYLPRDPTEEAASDGAAVDPLPQGVAHRGSVLVVDDEPAVCMLVAEALGDSGFRVMEAANAAEALIVIRSPARVDLLITDVGLPGGMNGRQLAEAARQLRPGQKTLFITGYAENAMLTHGHMEPGMHAMSKPFALAELAARVRLVLGEPAQSPPGGSRPGCAT